MKKETTILGKPHPRIDGHAKVAGRAVYPADEPVPGAAHACLVTSTVARGRVTHVDLDATRAVPGVLDLLTHDNVGDQVKPPRAMSGGPGVTTTLESDRVWHDGQIIGVVVADTYEAAREAARRVRVRYEAQVPAATFDCPGVEEKVRQDEEHEDFNVGDVEAALAAAPVRVDARYGTPTQHHNALELFSTTCAWNGGKLTIWESSQFVFNLRAAVAEQLGMDPGDVRVISQFVGGAFGAKAYATGRTAWIALAARRLGRPVKLVATREQGFTIATYRAETRHHVRLAATREGRLTALRHEGWEVTSRPNAYNVSGTETTARMYACPNVQTKVNLVHADRNTPGFMRAPPETPYMFALESAMDELAVRLGLDPVELRRRNEPERDPVSGLPFSSCRLLACLEVGAERFRWAKRDPRPGSMREGDWLIGWGMAAAYPTNIAAAAARVTLWADGRARVAMAGHEIGQGAYTAVAIVAAEGLGVPVERVAVEMGDSTLPAGGLAASSRGMATMAHAVARACDQLRAQLAQAAVRAGVDGAFVGRDPASLALAGGRLVGTDGVAEPLGTALGRVVPDGALEVYAEHIPPGSAPGAVAAVAQGKPAAVRGLKRKDVTAFAYGAQFVEVRVPRMVGAFAAGTSSTRSRPAANTSAAWSGGCPARCMRQPRSIPVPPATSTATWPSTTSR